MKCCNRNREHAHPGLIFGIQQRVTSSEIDRAIQRQDGEIFGPGSFAPVNQSPGYPSQEQEERTTGPDKQRCDGERMKARVPQSIERPESNKANTRCGPNSTEGGNHQAAKSERPGEREIYAGRIRPHPANSECR